MVTAGKFLWKCYTVFMKFQVINYTNIEQSLINWYNCKGMTLTFFEVNINGVFRIDRSQWQAQANLFFVFSALHANRIEQLRPYRSDLRIELFSYH